MSNLVLFRGFPVHVRDQASTASAAIYDAGPDDTGEVHGVTAPDANGFRWLNVALEAGHIGNVRSDVCYVVGDLREFGGKVVHDVTLAQAAFGVQAPVVTPQAPPSNGSKWDAPLSGYVIPKGGAFNPPKHLGVDLAAPLGTPIYARGYGVVYGADDCASCPGGNGAVLGTSDPNTNYGFGVNVVVRYAYADVPSTTQAAMQAAGVTYLFVRHAHLSKRTARPAQSVKAGDLLGYEGQSGNTTGPHLHLEVRGSTNAYPVNVFNETLLDPAILYNL